MRWEIRLPVMKHIKCVKDSNRRCINPSLPRCSCAQHLMIEIVPVMTVERVPEMQHSSHDVFELPRVGNRDPGPGLIAQLEESHFRVAESLPRVLVQR